MQGLRKTRLNDWPGAGDARTVEVVQLAREVNEAIAGIGRKFAVGDTGLDFFCECGAEGCLERLSMTISAFEGLRSTSEPLLTEGHPLACLPDALAGTAAGGR